MSHVQNGVLIPELHHLVQLQFARFRYLIVWDVLSLSVEAESSNPRRMLANLIIESPVFSFIRDVYELGSAFLPLPGCPVDHSSTPDVVAVADVDLAANLQYCRSA